MIRPEVLRIIARGVNISKITDIWVLNTFMSDVMHDLRPFLLNEAEKERLKRLVQQVNRRQAELQQGAHQPA